MAYVVILGGMRARGFTRGLTRIDLLALLGAIVILTLASTPPLVEAWLTPALGNLGKIVDFAQHRAVAQRWTRVVSYISAFFALTVGKTSLPAGVVVMFLVPLTIYAYLSYGRFVRSLLVLSLATLLLALPAALKIRGGFHPFI